MTMVHITTPRSIIFALLALTPFYLFAGRIELDRQQRDQLKKETVYAIDYIQSYHYSQKRFAEIDPAELLQKYFEALDPSKSYLLQTDVQFLKDRFEAAIKPTYLYVGDLYPAFEIYNLFYDRVMARLDWIAQRLEKPFDLDTDLTFRPDRKDAEWLASDENANELWEQRLKYEIISELLADETLPRAIEKIGNRYERTRKSYDEFEIHNVQETFLTSLAQLYDPHTSFFSWDSAQEFNIQISNALVGIGATLRDVEGYCVIESLIAGGPAEMSGKLHPGDKIVAVAQAANAPVDVVGMKLRKIVQMIRGETGSEVRLTVIPASATQPKVIPIIREKIELTANLASARIFDFPFDDDRTVRLGVIDLPSFYGEGEFGENNTSTTRDIEELINKLSEKGMEGLILDLRNNGGGRLDEAVKLSGLFVREAPVVMKRNFNGSIDTEWDRNSNVAYDGPLVVLVSRGSASASEIVAGALQSYNRAIVVGDESTHGKGTVQAPIDLKMAMRRMGGGMPLNVGMVKVTIQQFFLPNGESTQNRGVLSDIALPSANMFIYEGEADLDNALAWDTIEPAEYKRPEDPASGFNRISTAMKEELAKRSKLRIDSLPEFDYLKRNIEWFRERHDRKEWSLNLEVRRAERERLEELRNQFENERDQLKDQHSYPSSKVSLELTEQRDTSHQSKLSSTPLPDGSPRANRFYQKVYYYQADPEDKIHEVWVEYLDYEKMLDHSESIAEKFNEATDLKITTEQMHSILNRYRNLDLGTSFNAQRPFSQILGDSVDTSVISAGLPAFYRAIVEIDPDVVEDSPNLDIALREGLRILADWIQLEGEDSDDKNKDLLAAAKKKEEETSTR